MKRAEEGDVKPRGVLLLMRMKEGVLLRLHRSARRRVRHASGLTLIELLVAFTVLAVGLLVIIRLYTSGVDIDTHTRNLTLATLIGQDKMESILRAGSDAPYMAGGRFGQPDYVLKYPAEPERVELDEPLSSPSDKQNYGKYRWQAEVRGSKESASLREVTVIVTWYELGREQKFTLTSLMSKRR